jgi:hypothetical protein
MAKAAKTTSKWENFAETPKNCKQVEKVIELIEFGL